MSDVTTAHNVLDSPLFIWGIKELNLKKRLAQNNLISMGNEASIELGHFTVKMKNPNFSLWSSILVDYKTWKSSNVFPVILDLNMIVITNILKCNLKLWGCRVSV